jgi:hypothetical protein
MIGSAWRIQVERSVTAEQSPIKRAFDWIWRGKELRALRAERPKATARQLEFLARSRKALAVARTALEPPLPAKYGPMEGVACELYREAVYWALRMHRVDVEAAPDAPRETLEMLFQATDRKLLEHAAGDATRLDELERAVASKDFVDFAELSRSEQQRLTRHFEPFAEALATGIGARELAVQKIWARRAALIVSLSLLTVFLIWSFDGLQERRERAQDLARNKPWIASSSYGASCTSPEQSCPAVANYFFHTHEEKNPWLIFDLEAPQRVSGVHVFHRLDCCQERGLPLIVELSSDQKTWTEVARRTTEFQDWKAKFSGREARFVRLRAEGTAILHFSQVRILP